MLLGRPVLGGPEPNRQLSVWLLRLWQQKGVVGAVDIVFIKFDEEIKATCVRNLWDPLGKS